MFRFLQACYWTLFCRQVKPQCEEPRYSPYRVVPDGWGERDRPDPAPVYPEYKVSEEFILNEDHLAHVESKRGIHAILPGKPRAEQYWMLEGSKLTITHIHSPAFVCVIHTVTDRSVQRFEESFADQGPISEMFEHDFAPDGESFIVTFDELARMEQLHRGGGFISA